MRHRLLTWVNRALRPTGLIVVESRPSLREAPETFPARQLGIGWTPVRGTIDGGVSPIPTSELSVTVADLAAIVPAAEFTGARVLEVGPKVGHHTRWLASALRPSEFVLIDLATAVDHGYAAECGAVLYFENILEPRQVAAHAPFDLIVCLGVLYHNVDQFRLLATLWELARPGTMLALESTVTPLENRISAADAILEIRWDTKRVGNFLLPSTSAIATMLAMTGWTDVRWYQDFRTVSSAALLTARRAAERPVSYHGNPFGLTPHALR